MKIKTLALIGLAVLPLQHAAARDIGDIYTQCGLGGLIAPRTPALAVTTNLVWDLGTTASSSDISSPESCKGSSAKAAAMIYRAYPSLERELAAGQGENLDALLSLAQCDDGARATVVSALRGDLAGFAGAADYGSKPRLEQARDLHRSLSEHAGAQACNMG